MRRTGSRYPPGGIATKVTEGSAVLLGASLSSLEGWQQQAWEQIAQAVIAFVILPGGIATCTGSRKELGYYFITGPASTGKSSDTKPGNPAVNPAAITFMDGSLPPGTCQQQEGSRVSILPDLYIRADDGT